MFLTEDAVSQEQSHREPDRGCSLYTGTQKQRRRSGLCARDKACKLYWTAVSYTAYPRTPNGQSCYQGYPWLIS